MVTGLADQRGNDSEHRQGRGEDELGAGAEAVLSAELSIELPASLFDDQLLLRRGPVLEIAG